MVWLWSNHESQLMKDGPDIARIAALVGDPARANMLTALVGGMALTAGELAREAAVTPATASSHLSKLEDGGLVTQQKQGRHRYFRLSGPDVADVLERLMGLAARAGHARTRPGPKEPAMRRRGSATTIWPATWACRPSTAWPGAASSPWTRRR